MANAVDKEQIEMLSRWWKDYGRSILLAIAIGLLIGFGWRYWYQYKFNHRVKASGIYQVLFQASTMRDANSVSVQLQKLKDDFSDTPYAELGSLLAAHDYVESDKNKDALDQLNWVIDNGHIKVFKQIARVRKARILLSDKQYSDALTALKTVDESSFQPMIDGIKGDIYAAQGDVAHAQNAYKASKAGYEAVGIEDPLITIKSKSEN